MSEKELKAEEVAGGEESDTEPAAEEVVEEAAEGAAEEAAEDAEAPDEAALWKDRYIRLQAEFQNYKKRTDKEKAGTYSNAIASFAGDLLEVVDGFERAVTTDVSTKTDERFLEGMRMILDQLNAVLKKNGVEEIQAEGEEFDPNVHEALTMVPSDKVPSGHVVQVVKKGYRIKESVIRHPQVIVAQ
ncbi:MAG: nucleotide exchange factor GrpE [Clostridiales Family XIII bacterium]|jgi:molecular chaperone GrpE|nr:nucleotide exchange factor GrpE [Clostridiales Family XIII bacterium]